MTLSLIFVAMKMYPALTVNVTWLVEPLLSTNCDNAYLSVHVEKPKHQTQMNSSDHGSWFSVTLFIYLFIFNFAVVFLLRSSRDRSSHTRERERSLSQEKNAEGWRDDRAEYRDWEVREDRERSPSADTAKGRERERSLSFERDRRSSSEERESGEIWTEGDSQKSLIWIY